MLKNLYFNPYSETNFFQFFVVLFGRIINYILGNGEGQELVSDEIQLAVLSMIAIASALIGTFLVLRKMTMLANALSHTALIGIALAYVIFFFLKPEKESFNILLFIIAAIGAGLITAFLTEFLTKIIKLQEDASIGLVFTTLFAAGILIVTLFAKDAHIGTELLMGNVDALKKEDLRLAFAVLALNSFFIIFFFKQLKVAAFDPFLSATFGFSPTFFHYLLTLLTAATTICAFRAVGVLMVLAFLTGPPLIARLFTHSLSTLLLLASLIGVVATFIGVALSRHALTFFHMGLSTGGITVCVLVVLYILALLFSPQRGLLRAPKNS